MNRLQQILGMAVALGGFAPSRFDYPYHPQESVSRRRGKVGTIPGFVNCHCTKCDPDDEPNGDDIDSGYPSVRQEVHCSPTTKGPKKLSRAQRKAKRKR